MAELGSDEFWLSTLVRCKPHLGQYGICHSLKLREGWRFRYLISTLKLPHYIVLISCWLL